MKSLLKTSLAVALFALSTSVSAQIKVIDKKVSPRLLTSTGETISLDVYGKSDKAITGGRLHTKITLYGAVIYETSDSICRHLDRTRCTIRANDLATFHNSITLGTNMADGWYHVHFTATDQDGVTILDTGKCFKLNDGCRAGFLCYL